MTGSRRGPKPGAPKQPGSGRKKGTPNKKREHLHEVAQKHGVDPFEVLILIAGGKEKELGYPPKYEKLMDSKGTRRVKKVPFISAGDRKDAAYKAIKFLYPELRSIEFKPDEDGKLPQLVVMLPKNGRETKDN